MQYPLFYEKNIHNEPTLCNLSEETSKHCIQVLRMQEGDWMQLTDGLGNLVTAQIISPHKKKCAVKITEKKTFSTKVNKICIAIAPTKNTARLEWLLEKLTEIGIDKIILMTCDHSERHNIKQERLQHILVSAMLQSQQYFLPELSVLTRFEQVVTDENFDKKYIAHCAKDQEKSELPFGDSDKSKIILIGPEGDFSPNEIALSKAHQYKAVSLGNTRLRTETAGLVAAVHLIH